jgi:tRNA threonylcarbamoyl adenosine modification protein YeaZ
MPGKRPLTLALDCSLGGLAFIVAGEGLAAPRAVTDAAPRASDALHTRLQGLFDENGLSFNDLTTFIATTGPGSFTGIRIALAVGQAFRLTNPGLTLIGLPTLGALARQIAQAGKPGPFTLLLDASGRTAYRQTFASDGTPTAAAACLPLDQVPQDGLVYADPRLALPAEPLPALDPQTLLAMAADPAVHVPFAPHYIKALTYRTSKP